MTSIEPVPFGASSRQESQTPHGSGVGPLGAVQAAGQDARARGLAAAARAAEQVGVVDAAGGQRVPQRRGDVILADDLGERRRAVLAVQREVARAVCHASTLTSRTGHPATCPLAPAAGEVQIRLLQQCDQNKTGFLVAALQERVCRPGRGGGASQPGSSRRLRPCTGCRTTVSAAPPNDAATRCRHCVRRQDPPRTRQSLLILAAFRPWGGSQGERRTGGRLTSLRGSPTPAVSFTAEDSPSGLGRTIGNRVGSNPSGVQIPYPPPTRRPA